MPLPFHRRLAALRKEAGFHSAYRFYHGNGGRRHFPFTYMHYLRLERGEAAPKPAWAPLLLSALRLSPGEEGYRGFLESFLLGLLGSERAFETLVAPLAAPARPAPRLAVQDAFRWVRSRHSVHLTPEQFRAATADPAAYWCYEALAHDRGSWTPEALAATLDLDARAARAALARLKAAGLARRTAAGRYKGRWEGKFHTFPGRLRGMGRALDAARRHWSSMARRRGKDLVERVEVVRASEASMLSYGAALAESVEAANALAQDRGGEDSGLFLVEACVRKLTTF